jgi:hypothetical protein
MDPATRRPVLDLGSLDPDRPFIRIDGREFAMKVAQDLNLLSLARIEKLQRRVAELQADTELDPEVRATEQARVLREGVGQVLHEPLPAEVDAKLNDIQRLAILDAFIRATLRAASQVKVPPVNRRQRRSISRKPSPASAVSTAPTTG